MQGTARPAGCTLSIPEKKAGGGTLAVGYVFSSGTLSELCARRRPRAPGPGYVLRVGGRRAAPSRAGPGLRRQWEPLSSLPAMLLLYPPPPSHSSPPSCLWVLPFLLGAGGVLLKSELLAFLVPRSLSAEET